jgi:hypothetical protein
MHIRRRLLFAAVTPLALGVAASTACADPNPPAAATSTLQQSGSATRTATVVTELSAQEVSAGSSATLQVKGRLVEGDTLLFPLSRLAVSVQVREDGRTAPQKCNTVTTREGRFSCTFNVTAHKATSATVTFAGNALFAPGTATTSIADLQSLPPSASSSSPAAAPKPAAAAHATVPNTVTRPAPVPSTSPTAAKG